MRGGGRSFSSRGGHSGDREYGGKFRGSSKSYRDGGSSMGRFNQNRGNDRRFDDSFNKVGPSNRNRSRYDRRSPDRFSHNDRSIRVNNFKYCNYQIRLEQEYKFYYF